jgi:hypothetical protein
MTLRTSSVAACRSVLIHGCGAQAIVNGCGTATAWSRSRIAALQRLRALRSRYFAACFVALLIAFRAQGQGIVLT